MDTAAATARKALALSLLGFVAAALLATGSPAAAQQRDPFQPLVDPGAPAEAGVPAAQDPEVVLPQPVPGDDPLPETGSSVSLYTGAAYILVALGSAALILARLHSRPPGRNTG